MNRLAAFLALVLLAGCSTVQYERPTADARQTAVDVHLCEAGGTALLSGEAVLLTLSAGALGVVTCVFAMPVPEPTVATVCGIVGGAVGLFASTHKGLQQHQGRITDCMADKGYRPVPP